MFNFFILFFCLCRKSTVVVISSFGLSRFLLEAELGEKPFVLPSTEAGLEDILHFLLDLTTHTLTSIELVSVKDLGKSVKVKSVPSGHHVVPVHNLHKRLDGRATHDLALGHALQDSLRRSVNTSNNAVAVLPHTLGPIHRLDNNSLVAGISPIEHNNNLTWLKERLGHLLLSVVSFFLFLFSKTRINQ